MGIGLELRMYAGAVIAIFAAVLCGAGISHVEAIMVVFEALGFLWSLSLACIGVGVVGLLYLKLVELVKSCVEYLAIKWAKRKYSSLYSSASDLESQSIN